jgi:hypothetical protein
MYLMQKKILVLPNGEDEGYLVGDEVVHAYEKRAFLT